MPLHCLHQEWPCSVARATGLLARSQQQRSAKNFTV
jgi:hypothetical protein